MSERGLQVKSDIGTRRAEDSDFPNLCEACFGENPYIRMQRNPNGGKCKMCDRLFTVFRWRAGRGEGYKKTEVCMMCSRLKNICQTCILDLQFGLPSQLRDSVLSYVDGMAAPQSDVQKEFQMQRQIALLDSGENPWEGRMNPNEQLVDLARTVVSGKDRKNDKVKLPSQGNSGSFMASLSHQYQHGNQPSLVSSNPLTSAQGTNPSSSPSSSDPSVMVPLPPGITSMDQLQKLVHDNNGDNHDSNNSNKRKRDDTSTSSSNSNDNNNNNNNGNSNQPPTSSSATKKSTKSKALPPRPPGPPPPSAFKQNQDKEKEIGKEQSQA